MICGYIYKIEFPNGKHYIGLTTTSLKQRQEEHKKCAKSGDTKYLLYKALRKYEMVDAFELIEIDTADTVEELREKEIEYILMYNSYYMNKKGYNMTLGGEGTNGYVFTEEDKQKMSESQKKFNKENPEAAKEHGEKMKLYYQEHPETAKEHSERMKKRFEENPDEIEKISERMKKYHEEHPETGKEHSERMKKYYEENPELRQKMSEVKKQLYEENPEMREKCSERVKKYYQDNPEANKINSDAQKKYHEENPEARQKLSQIHKKRFEENPEAGKEHGKKMKQIYKENPEMRQKMSEVKKKYFEENPEVKKNILDIKGQNKQFDAFTVDGIFIKTFTYQFEAKEYLQKEYNITCTLKIGEVLAGNRKSSAGFVFKYK